MPRIPEFSPHATPRTIATTEHHFEEYACGLDRVMDEPEEDPAVRAAGASAYYPNDDE